MTTSSQLLTEQTMTRCECQEVDFADVIRHARRYEIWDFDQLRNRVGCGQICTACHCDLRRAIERERQE